MTRPRHFTGRDMTAILIAFFGMVITVNFTMARYAVRTFGGTVVDNSYVASQEFNSWLRQARRQAKLGWMPVFELTADKRISIIVSTHESRPVDAVLRGTLRHPLGQSPDRDIQFETLGRGRWLSRSPLPQGRWTVHLTLARGDDHFTWLERIT